MQVEVDAPFPSAIHFTLKMNAARSSKTKVPSSNTTQHHNPEVLDLDVIEDLSNDFPPSLLSIH